MDLNAIRSVTTQYTAPLSPRGKSEQAAALPQDGVTLSMASSPTPPAASTTSAPAPVASTARPAEVAVALSTTPSPLASGVAETAVAAAPRPADLTERLKSMLPDHPFVVSAQRAAELKQALGLNDDQLLQALVPVAKAYARPPISNYLVGAAGLGKSGNIYLGVNGEFPGNALNQTWHGEQSVVTNALRNGEEQLTSLAVSAAPCGHCRQFLNELNGGKELRILVPNEPPTPLDKLLPASFGPGDLGVTAALLSKQDHRLSLQPGQNTDAELTPVAFQAANGSYAPYSHDPAGIALRLKDGSIYSGKVSENAAFNPSLSPLQGALIAMVAEGRSYDDIQKVVLVEREAAKASQVPATRTLLDSIKPGIPLEVALADPYKEG